MKKGEILDFIKKRREKGEKKDKKGRKNRGKGIIGESSL